MADRLGAPGAVDALRPDRLEVSDRLTLRGLGRWASAAARARAESFPWSRTTDTMLALHGLAAPMGSPMAKRMRSR